MIASSTRWRLLVRFLAGLVWRGRRKTAAKLAGFAATEQGSALDMLRAAELEQDPKLRRLFFVHALDEHRHAARFAEAAERIAGPEGARASSWERLHAQRQNLYESMSKAAFLAFVHHAETQGQAHFAALARHFAGHAELGPLFAEIERDERFHVRYAGKALARCAPREGTTAARALWRVRVDRSWQAFRRSGRRLGEGMARLLLLGIYVVAVPPFALLARREAPASGWVSRRAPGAARRLCTDLERQHR